MQQEPRPISTDTGPWRDGRYVVASHCSQMPRRCMACGTDVAELKETPVPLPSEVPVRGIISGAHHLFAGERFAVRHGRCDQHRIPWTKHAGLLAGIASIVAMLALVAHLLANNARFSVVDGALCGAFVFAIGATIWCAFNSLQIAKTDGKRVWIGGFGAGYLAALPVLPKRPANADRSAA